MSSQVAPRKRRLERQHTRDENGLTYREVFFAANGFGPWTCVFCGDPVQTHEVDVHHRDEDRQHNTPDNLAAAHHSCHLRHHKLQWWANGNRPQSDGNAVLTPEERSARSSEGWSPDRALSQTERMRQLWADPEWKARQQERLREAAARRWSRG